MKKVGLFIPCYIDTIYPNVAEATYKLLTDLGFDVEYPLDQSCCGQPFLNSGYEDEAKSLAKKFIDLFSKYEYIVAPSASCVSTIKNRYKDLIDDDRVSKIEKSIFEICEFLHDEVRLESIDVSFPYRVGFHQSCHGLRELNLGVSSELSKPYYSKARSLLELVKDIKIVDLKRADECCGFGGTFSIKEPEISIQMGKDRIEDHLSSNAEYIVGYDSSCLMHMQGIIDHDKLKIKTAHIVEILSGMIK